MKDWKESFKSLLAEMISSSEKAYLFDEITSLINPEVLKNDIELQKSIAYFLNHAYTSNKHLFETDITDTPEKIDKKNNQKKQLINRIVTKSRLIDAVHKQFNELGAGISRERSAKILDIILDRLHPNEYEDDFIKSIAKTLAYLYKTIKLTIRGCWQLEDEADEKKIKRAHQHLERADKPQDDSLNIDGRRPLDSTDEYNEVTSLNQFRVFVQSAVDWHLMKQQMSKTLKEKIGWQEDIENKIQNEGLVKPVLMSANLQDIKNAYPNEDYSEVKDITTPNLDLVMSIVAAFREEEEFRSRNGILRTLQKVELETDAHKKLGLLKQLTSVVSLPATIIKEVSSIIDDLDKIHKMAITTEKTVKSLKGDSGIVSVVAGTINLFTIPIKCAIEKRLPNRDEWIKIGLSSAIIVLGSLLIASVGGAVAAGAFYLSITLASFVKSIHDSEEVERNISALTKQKSQKEVEVQTLLRQKNLLQKAVTSKIEHLQHLFSSRPDELDYKEISYQASHAPITLDTSQLLADGALSESKALEQLSTLGLDELQNLRNKIVGEYVQTASKKVMIETKLEKAIKTSQSIEHKGKNVAYIFSGILAIAGAITMFVAPPIGAGFLIGAAALSGTTILYTLGKSIYQKINQLFAKKATKKTKEVVLNQETEAPLFNEYRLFPENKLNTQQNIEQLLSGPEIANTKELQSKKESMYISLGFSKLCKPAKPVPSIKKEKAPDVGADTPSPISLTPFTRR